MNSDTEIAIIGAGPYGLSIAAHLRAGGKAFRIFGFPMHTWAKRMPAGMHLKSDGFASSLYAPGDGFSLKSYCDAHALAYSDLGLPVALETFVNYGMAFQREMVPTLEPKYVEALSLGRADFSVRTADGERFSARRVIMATGVSGMEYVPSVLSALPSELCSHSAEHHDLSRFVGRQVIVIGGGASATDVAALLHAQGTSTALLSRHPVAFHSHAQTSPSRWERITKPNLGLGPNFRSAVYTAVPGLFRLAPAGIRSRIVRNHLGPAGGWFIKDMVLGKVAMHSGFAIRRAEARSGRVVLHCDGKDGGNLKLECDHVIAATGYRVSLARLGFLDQSLLRKITTESGSPRLSHNFESSVPGLHFVGLPAAASFGPLLRFAVGARYAARRLAAHINHDHGRIRGKSRAPAAETVDELS
jgi:cation diffusion facilitator CzcD-associated flavoprotein CzcO